MACNYLSVLFFFDIMYCRFFVLHKMVRVCGVDGVLRGICRIFLFPGVQPSAGSSETFLTSCMIFMVSLGSLLSSCMNASPRIIFCLGLSGLPWRAAFRAILNCDGSWLGKNLASCPTWRLPPILLGAPEVCGGFWYSSLSPLRNSAYSFFMKLCMRLRTKSGVVFFPYIL